MAVQADLILAGFYNALVDGEFGPSTLTALQDYQRSIGDPVTGVMSARELSALKAEGTAISGIFGLQTVDDVPADLEISVPTKLLPTRSTSESGTTYQSPGGGLELQTTRVAASDPAAFNALFQERNASSPSRVVRYSHFGASSFTVTGLFNGRHFYDRFYKSNSDVVGFTLTWDDSISGRGAILAAYLASFSRPTATSAVDQLSADTPGTAQSPSASGTYEAQADSTSIAVPLRLDGGTYVVPVLINGALTLNFTVDSGAADVTIPADVVLTLVRTGTITSADFLGSQTYILADGSTVPSETFRIRSLKVGGKVIENVLGSVASVKGSLLLGQSFLSRFSSWSMDNSQHALVLGSVADVGSK